MMPWDVCHLYGFSHDSGGKKRIRKMVQAEGMYQMAPMGYRRALLGKVTLRETLPWGSN